MRAMWAVRSTAKDGAGAGLAAFAVLAATAGKVFLGYQPYSDVDAGGNVAQLAHAFIAGPSGVLDPGVTNTPSDEYGS